MLGGKDRSGVVLMPGDASREWSGESVKKSSWSSMLEHESTRKNADFGDNVGQLAAAEAS